MILSRPYPDYKALFSSQEVIPEIYSKLSFYSSGRYAMLAGLKLLGVRPKAVILLPAYICNSLVSVLRESGFRVVFIDIEPNLQLDVDKVVSNIELYDVNVLVVVHYFGISCDLHEILIQCRLRGVTLIEDCCHSFLTSEDGVSIGNVGDAAIYSLRKTLPISDGGALQLNKPLLDAPVEVFSSNKSNTFVYLAMRCFERFIAKSRLVNLYSPFVGRLKRKFFVQSGTNVQGSIRTSDLLESMPSFQLKRYLGNQIYLQNIKSKVISNYQFLTKVGSDDMLEAFIPILKPDCVPQWIPFLDHSEKAVNWLRNRGVGASRWPWHELPSEVKTLEDKYPNSCELDRKLMLLPVHQSLKIDDLEKMSFLISEFRCHLRSNQK